MLSIVYSAKVAGHTFEWRNDWARMVVKDSRQEPIAWWDVPSTYPGELAFESAIESCLAEILAQALHNAVLEYCSETDADTLLGYGVERHLACVIVRERGDNRSILRGELRAVCAEVAPNADADLIADYLTDVVGEGD